MILVDTHTHLYSESFQEDQDAVIQKALEEGIQYFFIPAIDATYTKGMYDLEAKYPKNTFLMMGLHPTHVKENYESELQHVYEEVLKRKQPEALKKFYAIGEIGIDLYWDRTFLKEQLDAFKKQIRLAKKYQLPIVIHCREAFDEVFDVLEEEKGDDLFGIFHCFTGDLEQAQKAISYNMKLGIGGVVTFKNGKIDRFLRQIPIEHIVLETDAPYLAPVPYRGKRNESAYLTKVLSKVANIYDISEEAVAKITTETALNVFSLKVDNFA
ncbi:TatD family hydrolase [Aquimarina sp. ERC-38]|uniref:TatD family hydrolase n=1 Tax=Aquimarina sp. ERC-38 TaxID=2949996 RepID=UPI00224525CC|nr:TatD family hydrolase [Aquimarina sp. ERC-38]UZO81271.1 TatD family hydrolase [Aquimarina sp. ERC-38]